MAAPANYNLQDAGVNGWEFELDFGQFDTHVIVQWIFILDEDFGDDYEEKFNIQSITGQHFKRTQLGDEQWCRTELGMNAQIARSFSAIVRQRITKYENIKRNKSQQNHIQHPNINDIPISPEAQRQRDNNKNNNNNNNNIPTRIQKNKADKLDHELQEFLIRNNLLDIHDKLVKHHANLEHLKSVKECDLDDICSLFELNVLQKIRFQKAIESLHEYDKQEEKEKLMTSNIKQIQLNTTQKITIIGDSCVGKTWLCRRLKTQEMPPDNIGYTVKPERSTFEISVNDNLMANYNVWDTAGQPKYKDTTPLYFTGSLAIIIMFDICDRKSYENIRASWIPMIDSNAKGYDKLLVVGNKLDLKGKRKITEKDARMYCMENDCDYVEVSCKTGENIDMLLTWIKKQTSNY